jgi:transposase
LVLDPAWVGVDIGTDHHWAAAVDADGQVLLSRMLTGDQQAILALLAEVAALARRLTWTVDLTGAEAALLLAVLWGQGQQVRYLAGRAVSQAAVGYRGAATTDAKDARSIAEPSRMRRDLPELRPGQDLVVERRILTSRRADLVADRTRASNRLRQQLTAICPALERVADLAGQRGWVVVLLAHCQRPGDLRNLGVAALAALLAGHGVRNADRIAQAAVAAASTQTVGLPGQDVAGALAREALDLQARITQTDHALRAWFGRHQLAEVIGSMPGFGFRLGAELPAAIGQVELIGSADRLAAYAGLCPVANDSDKRTGRLRTPVCYHRALRRAMWLAALTAIRCSSQDRAYYQRKRAEGKRHVQAVICLARRRTNVLWALLRDHRTWQPQPPAKHQAA